MNSLQLKKPHMIVVVGLPGAGKSFFGSQFSDTFNAPFLDYDHYRRVVGDTDAGNGLASDALAQLFRTKQTLVVEGIGNDKDERHDIAISAKKHGYEPMYVWVQTEPQTSLKRALSSTTTPITNQRFIELAEKFDILQKNEPYVVISGKHTYASQARTVLKKLVSDRPTTNVKPRRIIPTSDRTIG